MAQNVGTAKVTIEADFSTFEKDMARYFGGAGDKAASEMEKGVKKGTDKAKSHLGEVGEAAEDAAQDAGAAFGDVGKDAGKAGQDASKQFGTGVRGVSDSAQQAADAAGKSFSGTATAAGRAGADASKGFSVGISGVSTATTQAVGASQSAFGRLVSVGSSTASSIANGFSAGLSSMVNAASSAATGVSNAFSAMRANVSANFAELRNSADSALDGISGFARGAVGATAGLLGLAGAGTIMSNAFAKNTSIEDTTAALTVMMGSATDAASVMDDLAASNQNTPYAFDAWAGAGKTLIAFGQDASKVSDTVTALGEAASATGRGTEALDSMSTAFGQALASGKISMETMNQLAAGGVNGLAILANQAGVSTEEMQKMISSGTVPAAEAIDTLTKGIMEGTDGIAGHTQALEGTMGAMSQTTSGVLTNLGAAFNNLGSTVLDFVFPAIKVIGQAMTDFVYAAQDVVKKLQAGEGVWGAVRLGILGIATAATVWAIPAIAALATAIVSRLGGSAILSAIKTANGFWFAAGGEGKTAGVITRIWSVATAWTRSAATAVVQGAKAGTAWLLAAPGNLRALAVAFGTLVAGWVRAAAAATVNAAKVAAGWVVASGAATVNAAKIAAAWVIAAPKNPLVWARAFGAMVLGWARAAGAATLNAAKIAAAWLVAAPKNIGVGIVALGRLAAGWVRAGIAAMVNGAKIATGWLIAMGPVGLLIGAIAGVVAMFVTLWNKSEAFRNFFIGIWDGIVNAVSWAWETIKNVAIGAWEAVTSWFTGGGASGAWDSIVNGAQSAWETVKNIWDGAVDFFGGVFGTLGSIVSTAWDGIMSAFTWAWETVLQPIYTWISETWGKIWEVLGPAWDTISEKVSEFGTWFSGFWSGTLWPLLSQVIDFFQMLGEKIGNFISEHWEKLKWVLIALGTVLLVPIVVGLGLVVAAITAVVLVVGLVVAAITGFVLLLVKLPGWIAGVVTAVGDWFGRMWQNVKDMFNRAGEAISGWWENSVKPLPGKVGSAIGSVIDWFKRLPGMVKGAVSDAGSWLVDTGKNIIQGLWNGLESMKDWIMGKVKAMADWVTKPFKKVLEIFSPSRLFKSYGVFIGEGLAQGMDSMQGTVQKSSQAMADSVKDVRLPEVQATAVVSAQASPAASTPSPSAGPGAAVDAAAGDPSAMSSAAASANQAFTESATAMANTAATTLAPMWQQQQASMMSWGLTAATQASTMVAPALASTGLAATTMNTMQWQPAMAGMNTAMNATGLNTQIQTGSVINPAINSVGATAWSVLNSGVNPALAGMRGAVANTANSFAVGARNIGVYWNQVREATAQPARFTINRVFNDGIVGMWNSATELLGTKKMARYNANFARGGTWRGPGRSTLPGYTPGRDPFTFVEPSTGMTIGMSGGESIMRPEVTKALGTSRIDSLNAAARMGGTSAVKRTLGNFANGGVVDSISSIVRRYFPMMTITSTVRNSNDNHGRGLAVDFSNGYDSTPQMRSAAQFFYQNYGKGLLELIHSPFSNNVKNGKNVGDGFGFYGAGTMNGHRNHVHVAAPAPLGWPGSGVIPVVGDGGMVDPKAYIGDMVKPFSDKIKAALASRKKQGGLVDQWPEAVANKMQAAAKDKMVKAFEEMGGDPGGSGVERWRPLAKKAMARVGFDWRNPAQVNAMMRQIASESGGNPGIRQQVIDVNSGGNEAVGLLQIIPGTFAAHRDPALPNDRTHPFANMVAALRYYKSRYGMDLTTMWGRGHGYHLGGVMGDGPGFYQKTANEPERVLSPHQTRSFDELVEFTTGPGWDSFVNGTGAGVAGPAAGSGGVTKVAEVPVHFHGNVGTTEAADEIIDRIAEKAW